MVLGVSNWDSLKRELQKEAESVFDATGDVVIVAPGDEDHTRLVLVSITQLLRISRVVEGNVIRWETEHESAVERIPEPATSLAKKLMKVVRPRTSCV
jgi:hypothetical protein